MPPPVDAATPVALIVLGAGASYGAVELGVPGSDEALRPPLTKDLFARENFLPLLNRYPEARALVRSVQNRLHADGAANLEAVLSERADLASVDPAVGRAFIALRFYLRDLIRKTGEWPKGFGGVTLLHWLVEEVEAWRLKVGGYVVWVTFNYDSLLETALSDHFSDWNPGADLSGFVGDGRFCVIKPHGSVDWVYETDSYLDLDEYPIGADDRDVAAARKLIRGFDVSRELKGGLTFRRSEHAQYKQRCLMPALSAPLAAKSHFMCPDSHLDHLKRVLPRTRLLMTFGWRAGEAHFLEILKDGLGREPGVRVVTSSPRGAAETAHRLFTPIASAHRRVAKKSILGTKWRTWFAMTDGLAEYQQQHPEYPAQGSVAEEMIRLSRGKGPIPERDSMSAGKTDPGEASQ